MRIGRVFFKIKKKRKRKCTLVRSLRDEAENVVSVVAAVVGCGSGSYFINGENKDVPLLI